MKLPVFDIKGKETEKIELPDFFEGKVNTALLAQAVRVYLANQRQGTAKTKTRGQVEGSTRKIYRQKGTGHARHGSIRAPIFRKGGIVFGPEPREYRMDLPQKMRKAALYSALISKLQDNSITIVDGLDKIEPKTKEMIKVFKNLKLAGDEEKILFVLDKRENNIIKSSRNIYKTTITSPKFLNTYEVLNNKRILFTKEAIMGLGNKQQVISDKQEKVLKVPKAKKESLPRSAAAGLRKDTAKVSKSEKKPRTGKETKK